MHPRETIVVGRQRPAVSVLVPFRGGTEDADRTLAALARLALGPGDEVVVADNSPDGALAVTAAGDGWIQAVAASGERSSYHARNVAADASSPDTEWMLFLDADTEPPADLLDRFFADPAGERAGVLAGGIEGDPRQEALVPRWARSRCLHRPDLISDQHSRPVAVTGNMLVRREAFRDAGGFQEGIRSGGDVDFSWRVQDAGWGLELAPAAVVIHPDWETLGALARAQLRYGAGHAWMNRHRPGTTPKPRPVRGLLRCLAAAPALAVTGRFERARFKLIDAVAISCTAIGYLRSNRPPGRVEPARSDGRPPTAILSEVFPSLPETFVTAEAQALRAGGTPIRVEAVLRADRPNRAAAAGLETAYVEDEGYMGRIGTLLALAARHPIRAAADVIGARRWPRDERVPLVSLAPMIRRLDAWGARHLHAHFAAGAAVSAARAARFLGVAYSVTAHAYEIFRSPQGLRRKLDGAAFATTGCEYNLEFMRERFALNGTTPLHEIVMGTDVEAFRRTRPHPGGRRVLAIGRLIPKKGFDVLVEAAAALERDDPLDEVVIVGEGPERARLQRQIAARGLEDRVVLAGARDPAEVKEELERSDLLAMPCVIAPDGDRDSMPVVVKEALAMEVPVAASDEVGLPELVRPEFGRLSPPGDASALAESIRELLSLSVDARAAMGARGRAWVAEHASVERESEKLAGLIAAAVESR